MIECMFYGVEMSDADDTNIYVCTILIVLFTIFLEFVVHSHMNWCTIVNDDDDGTSDTPTDTISQEALLPAVVEEQPTPRAIPHVDTPQAEAPQPSTGDKDLELAQKKRPRSPEGSNCCLPNRPPNVRANRFLAAVFLYAVVLTAFIMRMHDIQDPHIRPECRNVSWLEKPEPNWWVVVLLNILPFVAASFSLLRTVADCFLVRLGQGLGYGEQTSGRTWPWPPCMPLFGPFMLVRGLLAWPTAWMMGRPTTSVWSVPRTKTTRREDIEMQNEERRRLVDDVDGEVE